MGKVSLLVIFFKNWRRVTLFVTSFKMEKGIFVTSSKSGESAKLLKMEVALFVKSPKMGEVTWFVSSSKMEEVNLWRLA